MWYFLLDRVLVYIIVIIIRRNLVSKTTISFVLNSPHPVASQVRNQGVSLFLPLSFSSSSKPDLESLFDFIDLPHHLPSIDFASPILDLFHLGEASSEHSSLLPLLSLVSSRLHPDSSSFCFSPSIIPSKLLFQSPQQPDLVPSSFLPPPPQNSDASQRARPLSVSVSVSISVLLLLLLSPP